MECTDGGKLTRSCPGGNARIHAHQISEKSMGFPNDGLAESQDFINRQAPKITGFEGTAGFLNRFFDAGQFDDFDALSHENMRDGCSGQNHEVDIRAPFADPGDDGQGSENMTQANGIVGVKEDPADSVCDHYVVALKDGW